MKKVKLSYIINILLVVVILCTSCTRDNNVSPTDNKATNNKGSAKKFSVNNLSPYKISQNNINNKLNMSHYTYFGTLFFYTESNAQGAQLNISDLSDYTTLTTELKLGLSSYIWDGYLIAYSDCYDNSCIDVMNINDLSVTPLIPRNEFIMRLGWEMQPYNHYIFMYGKRNETDGLFCYDIITKKFARIDTGFDIYDYWIYNDMLFCFSVDGELYYAYLPAEIVNNARLSEESVINIADSILLPDIGQPVFMNDDMLIYRNKIGETNYQINALNYTEQTRNTIKEGYLDLLTVSDDWVYFKYYDEKGSIYRMKTDGSNEELFISFNDAGLNAMPGDLIILDDNEFIIRGSNNKYYHLSSDKVITEISN